VLKDLPERSDEMVTERQQNILNLIIDIFTIKPCKSLSTLVVLPFEMIWQL